MPEDMENILNYSPYSTNQLFWDAEAIPNFSSDELIRRINAFYEEGYVAIAGVIVPSWDINVNTAVNMNELATNHLRKGALLGPYCISYSIAVPGIKLYLPPQE